MKCWAMAACLALAACHGKSPEQIAAERGLLARPVVKASAPEIAQIDPAVIAAAKAEFEALEVFVVPPRMPPSEMPQRPLERPEFERMIIDGKNFDELTESANAAMAKMPEETRENFGHIFRYLVISATKSPSMHMKVAENQQVSDEVLFEALYKYVGGRTPGEIVAMADQVQRLNQAQKQSGPSVPTP